MFDFTRYSELEYPKYAPKNVPLVLLAHVNCCAPQRIKQIPKQNNYEFWDLEVLSIFCGRYSTVGKDMDLIFHE